ncbi:hypothetical protein GH5_07561 [Leishmania sp. Ghana 2012 LV757]|uniref:hypothetical protein n=1 Tax=Leishmania sp. Ghana 2012 LV757 TaxID=2803181 RepID=UPI001B6DD083|nr:hypothetical protein GH5_07561 [Leishmania sp. Ghana 2012 LV757]
MVSISACTRAPQRSRGALTLLLMTAAWCFLSMLTPSETMAVAQGSASATTGNCSYSIWTPAPPPSEAPPTVYPPGAVAYQRHNYTTPPESFFISSWYVAIIIILCSVCGLYLLLALLIIRHFDLRTQHQAQKVVEESYATKGYFNLDGKGAHGGRVRASGFGEERATSSRGHSSSFVSSTSNNNDSSSYDDSSDSESSSLSSEADDTVIQVNPFQR